MNTNIKITLVNNDLEKFVPTNFAPYMDKYNNKSSDGTMTNKNPG